MGNGNAKPSTNDPNYNHEEGGPGRPVDERRVNPSSPRASPRRSFSARQESPAPSTVPTLSRESTASLGQRIARHASQQQALDSQRHDDQVANGHQQFHQPAPKGTGQFREDDMAPPEVMQPEEQWQPQYGGQNHRRQTEDLRRDPVLPRRRKGVSFDDDLTETFEDPGVRLPPLITNDRPAKAKRPPPPATLLKAPPVDRISRSIEDREFRTVTEADVRDKLMNGGHPQRGTRFAEPQNHKKSPHWGGMDDDNTSDYSSSTASLASRPSRIPQRVTAPRRAAPVLPPLDSNDTLSSSNRQLYSARPPIRRQIPPMDTIPVEANFYHLYHHGVQKKSKRTQQRQW